MSKKSNINSIDVKSPCSEDWNEMTGNDEVRFCSHCSKHVNNFSEMTRKKAIKLVRESNGSLCVRYVQHPVTRKPMFAEQLFQITRRTPRVAAGVMSASIALSTQAYAQVSPYPKLEPTQGLEISLNKDAKTSNDGKGEIAGTITDQHGAIVVGAEVTVVSIDAGVTAATKTDENGVYRFVSLKPGNYRIETDAAGFKMGVRQVAVGENSVIADMELGITMATTVEVNGGEGIWTSGTMGIVVTTSIEYISPIAIAVANDDVDGARDAIIRHFNINAKEKRAGGITPLFIAVGNGNIEMVETLLHFRAMVNVRDSSKQTPIMRLDDNATPELVNLLVRYGAKVNLVDKEGNSALILSAGDADSTVLKALLDSGADVRAANKNGHTALMEAAENDDIESVRLLLERGAEVNAKNKEGDTAWDLASDEKIEKLLETYGGVSGDPDEDEEIILRDPIEY